MVSSAQKLPFQLSCEVNNLHFADDPVWQLG
jgi:hypothetical protein